MSESNSSVKRKSSLLFQPGSSGLSSSSLAKRIAAGSVGNNGNAAVASSISSNASVVSGVSNGSGTTKSSGSTAGNPTTPNTNPSATRQQPSLTTTANITPSTSTKSSGISQPSARRPGSRNRDSGVGVSSVARPSAERPTTPTSLPRTSVGGGNGASAFANSSSASARLKLDNVMNTPPSNTNTVETTTPGGGSSAVTSPGSATSSVVGSSTAATTATSSTGTNSTRATNNSNNSSTNTVSAVAASTNGTSLNVNNTGLTQSQLARLSLQNRSRSNSINRERERSRSNSRSRGNSQTRRSSTGSMAHLQNNNTGNNSPATVLQGSGRVVASGGLTVQELMSWSPAPSPAVSVNNSNSLGTPASRLFDSFPMVGSTAVSQDGQGNLPPTTPVQTSLQSDFVTAPSSASSASSSSSEPEMIKVCIRVRPPVVKEEESAATASSVTTSGSSAASIAQQQEILGWSWSDNQITSQLSKRMINADPSSAVLQTNAGVLMMGGGTQYNFDHVYGPETRNDRIFEEMVKTIVSCSMQGFNGSVFSYGQTSSGKTFTMNGNSNQPGIIPQAIHFIFESIQQYPEREFLIRVSYMEVYNEQIKDLLSNTRDLAAGATSAAHSFLQSEGLIPVTPVSSSTSASNKDIAKDKEDAIKIQYDSKLGITVVTGIKEQVVVNPQQCLSLIKAGESHRHVGVTDMNEKSSRAHTLFRLVIESRDKRGTNGSVSGSGGKSTIPAGTIAVTPVRVSTLYLVDLAGSESAKMTNSKGERAREARFINQSLLTLSTIIQRLSEDHSRMPPTPTTPAQGVNAANNAAAKRSHLPYRDSKLTRLLEPALDGNARIAIICTISPTMKCFDETANTLKFATRAKAIKLNARLNETIDAKSLLRAYREEIEILRLKLREMEEKQRLMAHVQHHANHHLNNQSSPSLSSSSAVNTPVAGVTSSPGSRSKASGIPVLSPGNRSGASSASATPLRPSSAERSRVSGASSPPTIQVPSETNSPSRSAPSIVEPSKLVEEEVDKTLGNDTPEDADNCILCVEEATVEECYDDEEYFRGSEEDQAMMLQMISEMERLILKADVDLKEQHSAKIRVLAIQQMQQQQQQRSRKKRSTSNSTTIVNTESASNNGSNTDNTAVSTTSNKRGMLSAAMNRRHALDTPLKSMLMAAPNGSDSVSTVAHGAESTASGVSDDTGLSNATTKASSTLNALKSLQAARRVSPKSHRKSSARPDLEEESSAATTQTPFVTVSTTDSGAEILEVEESAAKKHQSPRNNELGHTQIEVDYGGRGSSPAPSVSSMASNSPSDVPGTTHSAAAAALLAASADPVEQDEVIIDGVGVSNTASVDSNTWMSVASASNNNLGSDSSVIGRPVSETSSIDRDEDGIALNSSSIEDNNKEKPGVRKWATSRFTPESLISTQKYEYPGKKSSVGGSASDKLAEFARFRKERTTSRFGRGVTVQEEKEVAGVVESDDVEDESRGYAGDERSRSPPKSVAIAEEEEGTPESSSSPYSDLTSFQPLKRENSIPIEGLFRAYTKLEGTASKAGIVAPIATPYIPPVSPLKTFSLQELTSPCESPSVSSVNSLSSAQNEIINERASGRTRIAAKARQHQQQQLAEFPHAFPRAISSGAGRNGGVAMIGVSGGGSGSEEVESMSLSPSPSILSSSSLASASSILGSRSMSEYESDSRDPNDDFNGQDVGSITVPEMDTSVLNNVSTMLTMLKELITKKPVRPFSQR